MSSLASGQIRPVRRSGLRDEVYQTILDMVISDHLTEGTALRVEALAAMLEVSPTPVREALVQLESTGLVEYAANRGYRVADLPTAAEVEQIMDARMVLEVAAARRAAERTNAAMVQRVEQVVERQRQAGEKLRDAGDGSDDALVRDYLLVDHEFHDVVFSEAGNPFLSRLSRSLDAQSQRARQSLRHGLDDAIDAIGEHQAILDAIRDGDPDAADAACAAHLMRVRDAALHDVG